MMVRGGLACVTLLLLATIPSMAVADPYRDYRRRGFWGEPRSYIDRPHLYLGVRGVGLLVVDQETDFLEGYLDDGAGVAAFAGVKLGPWTALEFNWTTTWHDEALELGGGQATFLDDLYLMTFTGDLKIHFPTPSVTDPYFLVGGGYALLGADYRAGFDADEIFAEGPTFEIGGGINVFLMPRLSVGGQIYYRGIYFDEPDYDALFPRHDNYVSGVIFDVDLTVHL
jgi:hypothetical protein